MPTAATPKPWRRPLGEACGPSSSAAAMTAWTARQPVMRDQDPEARAAPFVALGLAFADAVHEVEGVEQRWEHGHGGRPRPGNPRSTPHTWGEPPQPLNGHTALLISAFR